MHAATLVLRATRRSGKQRPSAEKEPDDRKVVVELKAVDALRSVHRAQVLSYLRATELELGLLINFNVPVLKDGVRRLIHSRVGG